MRNVTIHTFSMLGKREFSVVDAFDSVHPDADLKSLRFIFHLIERPSFIGSIKRMANTSISYELEAVPSYHDMLQTMQEVVNDMLRESNTSGLIKIEVEVERM